MTLRAKLSLHLRDFLPYRIVKYRDDVARYRSWGISHTLAKQLAWQRPSRAELEETSWHLLPSAMLPELKRLVDVGAHVGAWCSALLRYSNPERLIAFEPVPETFERLKRQPFAGDPRVTLCQRAIGSSEGELTIHLTSHPSGHSALPPRAGMNSLYGSGWDETGVIQVPQTTLDRELASWVDVSLLKIDVQGFEKHVLEGATETLKKTKAIAIEMNFLRHYEGDLLFWELHQILSDVHGFELYNMSDPFRSLSGRSLWVDAVYLRKGDKHLLPTH